MQRGSMQPGAIFLHTGFRSGGTWMWERLRAQPGTAAFYEPLHEALASIDARTIGENSAGTWASGHEQSLPYFAEYASLLHAGGTGVAGYQPRFAFERYFLEPPDEDAALKHYLGALLQSAASQGRVPVLKFCRSLGRVAWLRRQYPQALHAVVLRDPVAQYRSSAAQLADGNRFFLVAPLRILARNRHAPIVEAAVRELGMRLPALPAGTRQLDAELCWRHLARLDEAARYRCFAASWTIGAIAALRAEPHDGGPLLIDADDLGPDAPHRHHVEASLRHHAGLHPDLTARPGSRPAPPPGVDETHASCAAFLDRHAAMLADTARALVGDKLAHQGQPQSPPRPDAPRWRDAGAASPASRLARSLYFAAIGASMPLRRLNGTLRRR